MMWRVPSVAVGTLQLQACVEPMTWALLAAVVKSGVSIQGFASTAVPESRQAVPRITGRPLRHLDGWIQTAEQTLTAWQRGAADSQAALLYGTYCGAAEHDSVPAGLNVLTQRLGLPRIAVVDASQLDGCRIPLPPPSVAGILLDRAPEARSRIAWQTLLESLWDAPVLGWLEESLPARRMADLLAPEQNPSTELIEQLSQALSSSLRCETLCQIAQRCPAWPEMPAAEEGTAPLRRTAVRVAVAYDEAFPCYAADTLELLEAAGAAVRDFSPLRCERIPNGTDVVLIGTGTADRFWPELSRNCCLQQSLRSFAARGGRIYAEGSGLAYLSRQVVLPHGGRLPMAGLIAVEARRTAAAKMHVPVELTSAHPSWLFSSRQTLRGYREGGWEIVPTGPLVTFALESESRLDMLARRNVIGSQVIMHFASQPALLARFLAPFAYARSIAAAAR